MIKEMIKRTKEVFGTSASHDVLDYIFNIRGGNEATYQDQCLRTLSSGSCLSDTPEELLHAAMGLCTEAGEFIDLLKKYRFYGKEYTKVQAIEELGDLMWYIAIACEALGTTMEEVQDINIRKLKTRYPESFSTDLAIKRNIKGEVDSISFYFDDSKKTSGK